MDKCACGKEEFYGWRRPRGSFTPTWVKVCQQCYDEPYKTYHPEKKETKKEVE